MQIHSTFHLNPNPNRIAFIVGPTWSINYRDLTYKRRIGHGNFGEVWLADWFGSPVAVKTVLREHAEDSEFNERFSSEIEMMARLHHVRFFLDRVEI